MTEKEVVRRFNNREGWIPQDAKKQFGCLHCDWKNTPNCPHPQNLPINQICQKRVEWLLSLTPHYDKEPTFTRWLRDFNLAIANPVIQKYFFLEKKKQKQIEKIEPKLEKLEEKFGGDTETDELSYKEIWVGTRKLRATKAAHSRLVRERNTYHHNWTNLWDKQTHYADQQVHRDTPKKIQVTKTTVTPEMIHQIMRGEPIDIEPTQKETNQE